MPEHLDDANIKVVLAFTAGLFSLLGACLGAFLARRTDYERWLRQNRSEVFARFLEQLAAAQSIATNALHEAGTEQLQRDIKVTEAYIPVSAYAKVVRLYLPRTKREPFETLVRDVWALHSSTDLGSQRLTAAEAKRRELQTILEAVLGG